MSATTGNALFRADATRAGGIGHVMRCLALAEAWIASGGRASLIARTRGTLAEKAVASMGLDCLEALEEPDDDARQVAHTAAEQKADWIVLDGYAFDADYEDAVRAEFSGARLAVINDSLRSSRADLFVLPSSPLAAGSRITPGPTTLVGGFSYAILRKEYFALSRTGRVLPASGANILVVLGGTDAAGLVGTVIKTLLPVARTQGWHIRVVIPDDIGFEADPHLERILPSPSIAEDIAAADLMVCTASTVALEACACGVPQVLLVVADNQKMAASSLCQLGVALEAADPAAIPAKVTSILKEGTYEQMAARAAVVIDGGGARRVAAIMRAMDFTLRQPTPDDARFIFDLSNEAAIRQASFQSRPIEWSEHLVWFGHKLTDPGAWMRIVEDAGHQPFGVVRLQEDPSSGQFVISIALAASLRGMRLAVPILRAACEKFSIDHPGQTIRAEVKLGNIPSERTFLEAGFTMETRESDRSIFYLRK